jgi:hypothetical protein
MKKAVNLQFTDNERDRIEKICQKKSIGMATFLRMLFLKNKDAWIEKNQQGIYINYEIPGETKNLIQTWIDQEDYDILKSISVRSNVQMARIFRQIIVPGLTEERI